MTPLILFIGIFVLIALIILTIEYFDHKSEIKYLKNELLNSKIQMENIKVEKPLKPIKGGMYYLVYFKLETSQYYFQLVYETTFEKAKQKLIKKHPKANTVKNFTI